MLVQKEVISVIKALSKARVLVIGDVMMDIFVWGKVQRISPEAPVPVVDVINESYRLGGAANVANNLVSLGAKVFVSGVVGNDEMGRQLIKEIRKLGVHPEGLIVESNRPTTVKTRIIAHSQQVVRVDREKRDVISEDTVFKIVDFVKAHISEIDAILISDYAKGVICLPLMQKLKELAKNKGVLLTVDPKVKNFPLFEEVSLITPNHFEAMQACGYNSVMDITQEMVQEAGKILLSNFKTQAVLITQGELGMTLFEKNGDVTHIPAMAKKVYDVTGAGDTVIATLTAAWASGASLKTAAILANLAAGIVVGEVGTATVTQEQLLGLFL